MANFIKEWVILYYILYNTDAGGTQDNITALCEIESDAVTAACFNVKHVQLLF